MESFPVLLQGHGRGVGDRALCKGWHEGPGAARPRLAGGQPPCLPATPLPRPRVLQNNLAAGHFRLGYEARCQASLFVDGLPVLKV